MTDIMHANLWQRPLRFTYRNWRGEVSTRTVAPTSLEWGSTEWHPEPQWLLRARDLDKHEERLFALKDIDGASIEIIPSSTHPRGERGS